MANSEWVSKLEVAERQLIEAILLFFQRRDTIALHSLASAAHKVLSDIAIARGQPTIIRNNPRLTADPTLRKEYYRRLNEAYNFMKHADRDPDPNAQLEFRPEVTPHIIFDSVLIYRNLGTFYPPAFRAFEIWYQLKNPGILTDKEYKRTIQRQVDEGVDPADFELFLELLERLEPLSLLE